MQARTKRLMQLNSLGRKAKQYQEAVRQELNDRLGVGSRHSGAMQGLGGRYNSEAYQKFLNRNGVQQFQHGVAINDTDLKRYIEGTGGNPYVKKINSLESRYKKPTVSRAMKNQAVRDLKKAERRRKKEEDERSKAYFDFLEDAQAKMDEANAANEERYADILGRLEDRYDRNMDRVSNFGEAARADLDERFDASLGAQAADLASRGFGSSTMGAANIGRTERDRAREHQRLSEMVDSRAADYDQRLSNDIAAFMERRNDIQPDFSQLARLAAEYGMGNAGRGFNADEPTPAQVVQQPTYQPQPVAAPLPHQPQGVSPWMAANIANNTSNMLSGLTGGNYFNNLFGGWQPGITSNRYPENTHAASDSAREFLKARKQTLANIPEGYGDGKGGYGPVNRPDYREMFPTIN